MRYRYRLPERLKDAALQLREFANGAAQCHVRLRGGAVEQGVLVSNATAIIAMRHHQKLPFSVEEIEELFQTDEDCNPPERSNWCFFDDWSK